MHVTNLANACGSVARGLLQAYVKGCESICVVHDTPAPEPKDDIFGMTVGEMPHLQEPVEAEPYRMTGRIF